MAEKDSKKSGGLLFVDWTTFNNDNDPYYIKQEVKKVNGIDISLKDRYAVVVVLEEEVSLDSRDELQRVMDAQIDEAKKRLLVYYGKSQVTDMPVDVTPEDWNVSTRPGSRLKVLLSVPSAQIDALPSNNEMSFDLPAADFEILIGTNSIGQKIANASSIFSAYQSEVRKTFGKINKFSFLRQNRLLNKFISELESLLRENDVSFDRENEVPIIIGVSTVMKPVYVLVGENETEATLEQWNRRYKKGDEKCFATMHKSFDSFVKSGPARDKRTIHFLKNINEISSLNTKGIPTITDFLGAYVYDPPTVNLNQDSFKSPPSSRKYVEIVDKISNFKSIRTVTEEKELMSLVQNQEFRKEAQEKLEKEFLVYGSEVTTGIRELSDSIRDVRSAYRRILNKIPLQDLIKSALECLNLRGTGGFVDATLGALDLIADTIDQFKDFAAGIPKFMFPDKFPVTDYLKSIGKEIVRAVLNAIFSTLISFVLELLRTLLDFCKECAMQNVASGKDRFDSSNFNSMSLNAIMSANVNRFGQQVLGNIGTAITNPNYRIDAPTNLDNELDKIIKNKTKDENGDYFRFPNLAKQQNKILTDLERNSANILGFDVSNAETRLLTDEEKEELRQQATNANQQITSFMQASSVVLTPGEMGNLLLGCNAGQEPLDAIRSLLNSYPAVPIGPNPDDIIDFFGNIGSLTGERAILEAVKEATDSIPEDFVCLCDADDIELRKRLLSSKPISPDLVDELAEKSQQRLKKRQEDLLNALETGNYGGSIPPLYCTVDNEGNVIPGMLSKEHPVLTQSMQEVMSTAYDKLVGTFNREVKDFYTLMTDQPLVKKPVPRTRETTIRGKKVTSFNPDFLDLVEKGICTFGALPPGVTDIDNDAMENDETYGVGDNEFTMVTYAGAYITLRNKFGVDVDPDNEDQVKGMTRPFPESEKLYEAKNIRPNGKIGGRKDFDDFYTQKYGYSPVPIYKKERGSAQFAPGFQEVYSTFCGIEGESVSSSRLKILKTSNSSVYNLEIPNTALNNIGIDLENVDEISTVLLEDSDSLGGAVPNLDLSSILNVLNQSSYNLSYINSFDYIPGKESFGLAVSLEQGAAGSAPPLFLNSLREVADIDPRARSYLTRRDIINLYRINNLSERIPQANIFAQSLDKSIDEGAPIYSNGSLLENNPNILSGLANSKDLSVMGLIGDQQYNELWKDLYCSFTNQISESPYFDLENLLSLDVVPMKRSDGSPCLPHLLDIDGVKERVMEEYEVVSCLEASFPSIDGLSSNSENPFEKANLGGIVLLTLRAYILEVLLKSINSFYYFRFKTPTDVDPLFVKFISKTITQEIVSKNYIDQFEKEIIDLYSRNFPEEEDVTYEKALNDLVRLQTWSVSNRLSRLVGSVGDTSIQSILLEEWIPFLDVPKESFGIGGRLKNKSFKKMSDDITAITQAEIDTLRGPNGELSEEKINEFSGPWSSSINIIKTAPIGYYFRKYFKDLPFQEFENIKNVVYGGDIWSLETASSTEAYPAIGRDSLAYLAADGQVSPTVFSKNCAQDSTYTTSVKGGPLRGQRSREKGILINSGIIDNRADWNLVKSEYYESLSTSLNYKFGVSEEEKRAMALMIKVMMNSIRPDIFDDYSFRTNTGEHRYPGYYFRDWFKNNSRQGRYSVELRPGMGFGELLNQHPEIAFSNDVASNDLRAKFGTPINPRYMSLDGLNNPAVPGGYQLGNLNRLLFGRDDVDQLVYNGWEPLIQYAAGEYYSPWKLTENLFIKDLSDRNDTKQDYIQLFYQLFFNNGTPRVLNPSNTWAEPIRDLGYSGLVVKVPSQFVGLPWEPIIYPNVTPAFQGDELATWSLNNEENAKKWIKVGQMEVNGVQRDTVISNIIPRKVTIGSRDYGPWNFRYLNSVADSQATERRGGLTLPAGVEDPWVYAGPGNTTVFFPRYPEWASATGQTILNPNGTRGSAHVSLFNHAEDLFHHNKLAHMSILDYDVETIKIIFEWEKEQVLSDLTLTDEERSSLLSEYDSWISDWDNFVIGNLSNVVQGRMNERSKLYQRAANFPLKRKPMKKSLISDYTNGGFLLEPYIRFEPVDSNIAPDNADEVNRVFNNNWDTGIMNIDRFQELVNQLDNVSPTPIIEQAPPGISLEICNGTLTTRPNENVIPSNDPNIKLKDYFNSVSLGLRLNYVPPTSNFGDPNSTTLNSLISIFDRIKNETKYFVGENYTNDVLYQKTKSYLLTESKTENGNTFSEKVSTIPIMMSETSIDLNTPMSRVKQTYIEEKVKINEFGVPKFTKENISWARLIYKSDSGLPYLRTQMASSDDFIGMFNYIFPTNKMLSLNNIYMNLYMSTFKNAESPLASTKEVLKLLMFAFLDSGSWKASECQSSNADFLADFLNGFNAKDILVRLAVLAAKSALLIFKGFVEIADPNVQFSRKVVDLIHFSNLVVAQAQMIGNQFANAGQQFADTWESWTSDSCGEVLPDSCKAQQSPPRPPNDFWDPIEENFIPEPQIWHIGLPLAILAFFGAGIPATPFAVPYWILDNKPSPNWLNQALDDWLTKMLSNSLNPLMDDRNAQPPYDDCNFDLGLPPPNSNAETINAYFNQIVAQTNPEEASQLPENTYLSDFQQYFNIQPTTALERQQARNPKVDQAAGDLPPGTNPMVGEIQAATKGKGET